MKLDRSATTGPMYVQIANSIEQMIRDGDYGQSDELPSESELSKEFGVSRATAIKAYELLGRRQVVTRHQGKGTKVAIAPMERALPELTGFSQHIKHLGSTPGSELLSFSLGFGGEGMIAEQVFPPGLPLVVIQRLRFVDKQPVGTQIVAIPQEIADVCGITPDLFARPDQSLYELFDQNGIALGSGEESIAAVNATSEEAKILHVPKGTALIEVIRQSRSTAGQLVEVVQARYLGSAYIYKVQLTSKWKKEKK